MMMETSPSDLGDEVNLFTSFLYLFTITLQHIAVGRSICYRTNNLYINSPYQFTLFRLKKIAKSSITHTYPFSGHRR